MVFVERHGLPRSGICVRIREPEDQGPSPVVMYAAGFVLVVAMNVAVQHSNVVVGRQNVHHVITVAREPFPIGPEVEERTMREYDDGRRFRKTREIFLQPGQLFGTHLWLGAGNVIESYKMHAAVIEGVITLAEEFAVERAAVEASIMLARNAFDQR